MLYIKDNNFKHKIMLKIKTKWLLFIATLLLGVQSNAQEWTNLLDEDLSQWELWMGVPHVSTGLPGATSTNGRTGTPLGLENDPLGVFSVINEGGELQLKITGEVYGGLTTLREYADYHLSMEFKWGEDKFEPRLDAKRDSGLLYHCKGNHGSFWNVWKSCLELQVQETDCGDFFGLSGVTAQIQSVGGVFSPGGALASGNIKKSQDFENPNGEWNTIEVITVGDKSMHFVNGNLVNALENTKYNGAILNDGQIQIQSEGAEVYYRNMRIRSVTEFPAAENSIMGWDGTEPGIPTDAPIGSVIRLQKSGGDAQYVTVSSDGSQLIANTSVEDNGAEFTVEAHPNGGVGLKDNASGKYLQVQDEDNTLPILANGNGLGTWEQFQWVTMGTGKVALQSSHTGTWIQAAYNQDNSTLYPLGAAAGTWETFNFEITEDGGTVTPPITPSGDGKVLVFHKTTGFRHSSIDDGINMITQQGIDNGLWDTDDSQDSSVFTTANLAQYDVVVWCNTTGENLLTSSQEAAFEQYINNGGGFVGIHSATDTYRNRDWPFYNELVGGIVQTDPYHTSRNHNATMTVNETSHPTVDFLGSTWNKTEEYYYWRNNGGQLYDGNINLLTVESTGNNDYDEARPIAWYKEYAGGRSFYTALGHNDDDYSDDNDFIKHVEEGIIWAANFDDVIIMPPTSDNLALAGTATQSSTTHSGDPSRAIDGDTNGEYFDGSVTHTATENNAWWQVDLATQNAIGEINIYNRVGCCQDRLSNFTVIITDDNNNETYRQTYTTTPSPLLTINAAGALGKIVRVQSNLTNQPLSLAEVEVFAGEAVNTLTRIEAEDFDGYLGTQTEASSEGTDNVGYINNNDWLRFDAINLTGIKSFDARVACDYTGGTIEMRLGSVTGALVGAASVTNTNGNQVYTTVSANLSNVSGVNDIYFVFTGGSGYLFNVNWFELSTTTSSAKAITEVDEIEIEAVVYPNPSQGIVTIKNVDENAVVTVYGLTGQAVSFSQIVSGTTRVLDIQSLASGMYIISVNDNTYTIVRE